jgi:hypothetical protein
MPAADRHVVTSDQGADLIEELVEPSGKFGLQVLDGLLDLCLGLLATAVVVGAGGVGI